MLRRAAEVGILRLVKNLAAFVLLKDHVKDCGMERLCKPASRVEPIGPHHGHLERFEHWKGKPYLLAGLERVEREDLGPMGGKIPNLDASPTQPAPHSRRCHDGRSLERAVGAITADACLDAHQRSSAQGQSRGAQAELA